MLLRTNAGQFKINYYASWTMALVLKRPCLQPLYHTKSPCPSFSPKILLSVWRVFAKNYLHLFQQIGPRAQIILHPSSMERKNIIISKYCKKEQANGSYTICWWYGNGDTERWFGNNLSCGGQMECTGRSRIFLCTPLIIVGSKESLVFITKG